MHVLRNFGGISLIGLMMYGATVAQTERNSIGSTQLTFQLKDSDGKIWRSADFAKPKLLVVAFLGTECPLVKLYSSRLNDLQREFAGDVGFVGINSNQHDSISELQHFVRTRNISFPLLKDVGNQVADQFGATRTPEVFLLDQERRVIYQGCIDDQYSYGVQKSAASHRYLFDAIEAALANQRVATSQTEAVGCIIGRRRSPAADAKVTYANQISRILQSHCIRCHRAGQIAPFALTDYDEVAGWAEMIEEVVRDQRMPPWHADAEPGHFKNDLRLTADEKQLIYDWVAAGAPQGNPSELPKSIAYTEGWQIGEPDQIFTMSDEPFEVPATGVVPYKYFVIETGFTEDKWVQAAECRPGNRAVVHHIIVGVAGEGEFGEGVHDDLESEWISATAPGSPPTILPPGYAKLIPAGSKLVFQMHYTPNGTAQTDISQIGLRFADPDEVTHRVLTQMTYNDDFTIPAGADNHRVVSRHRIEKPVELLALFPHMHYRGKSFEYEFRFPDGTKETLLSVPNYDFNWQNIYELTKTRQLPAGTRVRCVAYFDNSEKNLANPDPTQRVRWGDQTWEEMMIGYFDVAVPK